MKKFEKILAASGGTEILAVIQNLPVSANGFFLSEEQMSQVEAVLGANETAAAEVIRLTAELGTATGQLTAATGELATAKTRITELEAMEGKVSKTSAPEDPGTGKPNKTKYLTAYDKMVL